MPSRRKSPFRGLTWLWSRSCWPCCTPDPLMQFVSHTSSPPTVLAPSQMQYFLLLNFMRFLSVCLSSLSRFLQMVAQPLKQCWMFGVHKLAKSVLRPITQVVTKVMRKQYWSLRDPRTTGRELAFAPLTTSQNRAAPAEVKVFVFGKFYCPEQRQLWYLKGCRRRAGPTSSQISCYTPRPYTVKLEGTSS